MMTYEQHKSEWNHKAEQLARDGRAERLWKEKSGDADAHTRDLVRWAFWQMSPEKRVSTKANRDSTDEAYFMNVVMTVAGQAREDERKRLVTPIIAGLQALLGPEAFSAVAAEMQWDD